MRISLKPMLLLLMPLASFAQKVIVPGSPDINISRLQTGKSKFTIYYLKDNKWDVKGTYTNDLTISGNELKFTVEYVDEKDKWYRSRVSIADAKTFSPVSYATKSLKNSLELKFGNPITGKYQYVNGDKDKPVNIKTSEKFVDFNVAEIMLTTLPLTTGYKATMPQFYLGSSPDSVVSNYTIKDVKSFIYQSPKTGKHESWLLSLLEEESGAIYTYIVDKKDHRIWQREMPVGGGTVEICVNEELDYRPIESNFDKELNLRMTEKGNSVITGTAFARDHSNGKGRQVLNLEKAQFAPKGTRVSILPNSAYLEEWKAVNKKIRKGKKLPEVPIDRNVVACFKTTKVYDDKGHFEFTNLMPGEYILMTTFGYTHQYSYQYYAGTNYLMHPSGTVLSSNNVYNTANGASGATAQIEKKVTIKKDGDKVDVTLKDVR